MKTLFLLSVISSLALAEGQAGVIFSENFETQVVGNAPSGNRLVAINNPTVGNSVKVVGESSDPADPFGPAGNKSLMMDKPNSAAAPGSSIQRITWSFSEEASEGWASFDLRVDKISETVNPFLAVYLMDANIGNVGVAFAVLGTAIRVNNVAQSATWTLGVSHKVEFRFSSNQTYTVYVDGNQIGGVFNYLNSTAIALDSIQFSTNDNTLPTRAFVDNIVVVPEPQTLALFGLAGAAMCFARRKRSCALAQ